MPSWSFAPCPTGALLCAGHAHLELALAKLTWSLHWPCSSGACAGPVPLPSAALGFLPKLHLCCAIKLAVMCVLKLYDLAIKLDHACLAATVSLSHSFS
jgi:hypothetical protein